MDTMRAHIERGLRAGERLIDFAETREREPAPQSTGRVWHALTQYRWLHVVDPAVANIESSMLDLVRAPVGLMSARIGGHDWAKDDMFTVPKTFAKAVAAAQAAYPAGFQFPLEQAAVGVLDIRSRADATTVPGRLAMMMAMSGKADAEFECGACGRFLGYGLAADPRPSQAECPGCLRTLV
ncbi:hypothetical protein [Streptomyces sp. NPDC093225]|uniref:hypothetical protein n=1 Tax=Streptomyces sp. NPDC093225 TaxID=3366034 RepID=UPI00380CF51B